MDLLNDFSVGLFVMQALILLVLVILLGKFAWKPIISALDEREQGIADALASADEARKEMANLQASNEAAAKEAREQRDLMLKEAREIKDGIIADAELEAKEKANKIMQSANDSIEAEKKAALADIKQQVAALSMSIAEKVTRKELAENDAQKALIDQLLNEANV